MLQPLLPEKASVAGGEIEFSDAGDEKQLGVDAGGVY